MKETVELERVLKVEEMLRQYQSTRKVSEEVKHEVSSLLKEYSYSYLQKKLGISYKTLKSWQEQYCSEPVFIPLLPKPEKEKIGLSGNFELKFSRSNEGIWSVEGKLPLKDWYQAIRLLEGLR